MTVPAEHRNGDRAAAPAEQSKDLRRIRSIHPATWHHRSAQRARESRSHRPGAVISDIAVMSAAPRSPLGHTRSSNMRMSHQQQASKNLGTFTPVRLVHWHRLTFSTLIPVTKTCRPQAGSTRVFCCCSGFAGLCQSPWPSTWHKQCIRPGELLGHGMVRAALVSLAKSGQGLATQSEQQFGRATQNKSRDFFREVLFPQVYKW